VRWCAQHRRDLCRFYCRVCCAIGSGREELLLGAATQVVLA
jgi:hypothetical protein